MGFAPLQTSIGVPSYFGRYTTRRDVKVPQFQYDGRQSGLHEVGEKYRIDLVAGDRDELVKALRLAKWLCEYIQPGGALDVVNDSLALLDHSFGQKEGGSLGLNGAQFAIVLSGLMLSIGVESPIVILEGFNPNQGGNHWVPVVWHAKADKWVMIDPMHHSYYRDKSGRILKPWEIRHNLVHQLPIRVNKDWGSKTYPW